MEDVLNAINEELIGCLDQYARHLVDESGVRNPDAYDDKGKHLKEKVFALRQLRQAAEDIIVKIDEGACRPPKNFYVCELASASQPDAVPPIERVPLPTGQICVGCGKNTCECPHF